MDEQELKRLHSKKKMGVFVVIFVLLTILSLAFYYTARPESPPLNRIVAARQGTFSAAQKTALQDALTLALPLEAAPPELLFYEFPEEETEETQSLRAKLLEDLSHGDANLYLLDSYVYGFCKEPMPFAKQTERYGLTGLMEGEYLIRANGAKAFQTPALADMPPLFFALRAEETPAVQSDAGTLMIYQMQRDFLDVLLGVDSRE